MMIFFVHIQKTSGSSINKILKSQKNCRIRYKNDDRIWYKSFDKYREKNILSGHVPYGIHKKMNLRKFSYFTFLRDPIQRWKSQFYHGLDRDKSIGYYLFEKNGNDLKRFLEWCIRNEVSSNIMVKQIYGMESVNNILEWREWEKWKCGDKKISYDELKEMNKNKNYGNKDFGYFQIYGWSGRNKKTSDKYYNTMLDEAKINLKHKFDFVGLQENSYEDHVRLCKFYGFKAPKKNVVVRKSSKKEQFDWEDKEVVALLNELNKYDIELYKYAISEVVK